MKRLAGLLDRRVDIPYGSVDMIEKRRDPLDRYVRVLCSGQNLIRDAVDFRRLLGNHPVRIAQDLRDLPAIRGSRSLVQVREQCVCSLAGSFDFALNLGD